MDKSDIANILEEMAVLLELKNANPFSIRAFHNAARAVESASEDLKLLAETDTLTKIPGIGKGISAFIQDLFKHGKSKEHEKLKKSFPAGFLDILKIPGVGPKRAKILYEKLGIKNVAELQYACQENRLLGLDGFGEKSQANILRGIEHHMKSKGFFLVSDASEEAEAFLKYLRKKKEVSQISIAGSLRRRKEIVHDVDILVSTKNHPSVHKAFLKYPDVEQVSAKGDTKSSVILKSGLQVDLRTVSVTEYPYALQHFTGSKEHNVALRTIAKRMGCKMSEYGLFKGKRLIACKNEEEIYRKLGLSYMEPELRENMGEIEASKKSKLPRDLIEEKDLKGTFHVHSTYSDGRASLEAMICRAAECGYEYVGISDHSKSAIYANGLSETRVREQQKEIDVLQKKCKNMQIFRGIESDILEDGSLDYKDSVLASFDFIIASIHTRFKMDQKAMTKRILRAMENPHTTMIGHLTGRLLLGREGYQIDYEAIFEKAKQTGCVIELNANPHRLDIDWRMLKQLKLRKLRTVINPDAHDVGGFEDVRFGVGIARKGWLEKKDVINTMNVKEMENFLKRRKNTRS